MTIKHFFSNYFAASLLRCHDNGITPLHSISSKANKRILMADDLSFLRNWVVGDKIIALLRNIITITRVL